MTERPAAPADRAPTTTSPAASRRLPLLVTAVGIPVLLFVALVAWGFSSPAASSPDDDFHMASIWCGLGEREGLCEASGDPATRLIPGDVINAPCFAFHPELTAECWAPGNHDLFESARLNASALYPPLFYAVMAVFAGEDVQVSVLAMRTANAALVVGLLTAVFWALPRHMRPAFVVSATATAVPLGLFLYASTNPSSWALLAATTVWITLLGATRASGRRQIVLTGLAVIAAVLGAGARADAAAFALLGVAVAALLGARKGRDMVIPAVGAALVVVVSVGFYLSADQSRAVVAGLPNDSPPLSLSEHGSNLLGIPGLWTGALGTWGLGWVDTDLPAIVPVLTTAVAFGAVFLGIRRVALRRGLALTLSLAAMWGVPFVLLAQSHARVGEIVQPRYVLPLLVIFVGVASLTDDDAVSHWRGPRFWVAAAALSVAAAVALLFNLRRHVVGTDDGLTAIFGGSEWWWMGVPSPLIVWAIGAAAFAAALVLLAPGRAAAERVAVAAAGADPGEKVVAD